ncbi:helix-turn-helix domain-containing protein [Paenibacillus tritici]|uniref:Helix-turn-helix domain-containing protein n=1 Tax=Paenibacillus tritici TaxID=1873425 RepID=A0ABX2DS72_9BACL|nr:helix-turn-helix domain-containing protein [Paenibacillus tritici]NQX47533.1 helix-turn-helix domain-containing protein [Paenibacillus tritici]
MKALIVDDEARVRKAVRLLVDWEVHQIEEILEAGSGNEAMGLIRKEKPALVIMDMMMESGSGLELMSWVDEFAGNTKFVVVSGHDDFDFVRQTVRHGGIDYILKPIEAEMINNAVSKAVSAWRAEEEERNHRQRQSLRLNEIKPIYGEKLLSALIDDKVNAEASLRRLIHDGIIPQDIRTSRLILLQTDSGNNPLLRRFGGDSELMYYAIVNICNEFLQSQRKGIAFRYWGGPPEIAIILWDLEESVTGLISRMNQGLYLTLQFRMHFGISTAGEFPGQLPAGRAEAAEALLRRNLLRHEDYCHFSPAEPAAGLVPDGQRSGKPGTAAPLNFADVQEDWRLAVISGTPEALSAAAHYWTQELSRRGVVTPQMLNAWKADAMLLRSRLVRAALGSQADSVLAELEQQDRQNPSPQPGGYSFSLFAWRDWSFTFMQQLSQMLSARHMNEQNIVTEIIKYIEQNYASDLSLQEIAGKFQVSREYVSRRFKQEYGINFSDYIVSVRIEKAKLLLPNPGLKLAQISEMVGFHDVKYFSKVFKKLTGLSPKDYRGRAE